MKQYDNRFALHSRWAETLRVCFFALALAGACATTGFAEDSQVIPGGAVPAGVGQRYPVRLPLVEANAAETADAKVAFSKQQIPATFRQVGEMWSGAPVFQTNVSDELFQSSLEKTLSSAVAFERLGNRLPVPSRLNETAMAAGSMGHGSMGHGSMAAACESQQEFLSDFSPTPLPQDSFEHDSTAEQWVYDSKHDVPTQHPWVEWGRVFYGDGITPRGRNWFGEKNLARPKFYVYGDYRAGLASGRNASGRTDNFAHRLNLDMDLQVTDTERFHAFLGPLGNGPQFTRWERDQGEIRFRSELDLAPVTGYFEGDLGAMIGAVKNTTSPCELPITIGLVPLLFQNGIWMEDAVTGAAFSLPSKHSRLLNWSNFDATFFVAVDQINSNAFGQDDHAGQTLGTAWFIEAYDGYIETG
ncbi:MAG: hypothetical protein P8L85_22755 [Rubripirellula sp.]|nr:hypothetical protein [Rubripirellula sp.]